MSGTYQELNNIYNMYYVYYVYINADTLEEENVLRVIDTLDGNLMM